MPEWLLKDENYQPLPDRDTFIDKSILSLLRILSRIRAQSGYTGGKHSVHAVYKVACTFLLIVLLSVSRNIWFLAAVGAYLLAALSLMSADRIIRVIKAGLIISFFSFLILLPAFLMGNRYSPVMIPLKTLATVTAVGILSHTTGWHAVTGALKSFFIPDIFIFVLDITIKYIVMLGELSLDLFYSLKLRSVGKNVEKYSSLSGIAGTMFLKSKEMAEDMYSAMECRGFTGSYRVRRRFRFTPADFLYIVVHILLITIFVYLG
ncbi:energy-coupling factor transporter transmembrane component T [Caproiciproducens faecalis]|uniref:Energy-coupling factor transporter transmembrane protein EcfT n=1 Tax=Caproiciproducens faecalis TaxID=2820301 RepID=A0ABS7DLL6_9FIRM|nr:energy-coupling factor transporter transmembrane component T [Caproiciproducens faecalis]MBW7571456.1 energy-coupling factor transporter transmembrane protein EcfT [Caproiciproducens faecalis]